MVLGLGREDRLERRVGEAADADECVADLFLLGRDLRLVPEVLEATPTAGPEMGARRLNPVRARREHLRRDRLGEPALHLRHLGADGVARKPPTDEDDEAVQPSHAVPAIGERVDRQLELVVSGDGRGHASQRSPSSKRSGCRTASQALRLF